MIENYMDIISNIPSILAGVFALSLALAAMGAAYHGLKSAGVIGADYKEDYEEIKENTKQNYEEYARERRKIEWMLSHPFLSRVFR